MTISTDDKTLETIIDVLESENRLGVLLAAQMGGTPQEIQLILQTTDYDEEKEELRTTGQYIIRAIGVIEHKIALGLFNHLRFSKDNPLLYRHNAPIFQIYFKGKPEQVDSLMLELNQLYGQTYGNYRHMVDEVNLMEPLGTLLSGGSGFLGEMPAPFAEKVKGLLARHGMETSFIESENHRPKFQFQLLMMDDSYMVAQMFSVDLMSVPGIQE